MRIKKSSVCSRWNQDDQEKVITEPSDIWVVIPAYNEDEELARVVRDVTQHDYSVVVVDDGSKRPAIEFLRGTKAFVCRHLTNLGQGAALQTGIRFAERKGARYLVTFDADGQHSHEEIATLIEPLERNECDIVLGSRFLPGAAAVNIPRKKYIVLQFAILFSRLTSGLELSDTHNGFRAMTADAARKISITQNGMAHATQFLTEIRRLGLRMLERPVTITYTEYSMQKGQRISNAFNIAWDSLMEMFKK